MEVMDDWEDLVGGGVLKKRVTKKGNGENTRPLPGHVIRLRECTFLNNEPVSTDVEHVFRLREGDVCQGKALNFELK